MVLSAWCEVDGCHRKPRPTPVRVLLPHEVLHCLAHAGDFAFDSIMLGQMPDRSRVSFWSHVSGLESWRNHPIITTSDWSRLVGVNIHGDGCEFYKDDEYFVWSWSSVFSSGGTIQDVLLCRFPIAIIPERHMQKSSVSWRLESTIVFNETLI